METSQDGTTITITKHGISTQLRHQNEAQADAAMTAIRWCEEHPDQTLREFVELWNRCHADVRLTDNSRASSNSVIDRHLLPYLGEEVTRDLGRQDVLDYIESRAAEAGSYRKVTPWVLRLQALLNKAYEWGLIDSNPVMQIDALFLGGKPDNLEEAA